MLCIVQDIQGLYCIINNAEKEPMSRAVTSSIVKWNPFGPSFACYDSQLKYFEVNQTSRGREATLLKTSNTNAEVTTLDWYQHVANSQALACGTSSGSVFYVDWSKEEETVHVVKGMNKYHSRQCTEVTWNKQTPGQLAAGFEKLRKLDFYSFFIVL
jgi:hypothetical protein